MGSNGNGGGEGPEHISSYRKYYLHEPSPQPDIIPQSENNPEGESALIFSSSGRSVVHPVSRLDDSAEDVDQEEPASSSSSDLSV